MKPLPTIAILLSWAVLFAGADPVQVSGTITDYSNKPVAGAIVRLAKTNVGDTTDAKGNFHIYSSSTSTPAALRKNQPLPFSLQQNTLTLHLTSPTAVSIELFNANGRLLQSIYNGTINAGTSLFPLKQLHATTMGLLRCRIGKDLYTCKLSTGSAPFGAATLPNATGTAARNKVASVPPDNDNAIDMLEITHPLYTMQRYLLNPFRDSVVAISICSINANWITELDSMYIDQEVLVTGLDNGNYMAMGQIHATAGDYNLSFFTLDPNGSVLTKGIYGTRENDLGYELALQSDKNVRVFGSMWFTSGDGPSHNDLMTMSVSPAGDSLDSRVFVSGDEILDGHGAVTRDGGYIIAGHRSFVVDPRGNYYVPHVTRVSPNGSIVWTKEYAWPHYYSCNSDIIALSDNGFVLSGYSYDDSTLTYSIWMLKIDANGTVQNKTILKDRQRPWVQQINETADKKLFLIGKNEIDDKAYSYVACFSMDCSLEWDTLIIDKTKDVRCMTPLENGSLLMAYNMVLSESQSGLPETEGIGILQMKTDGTVVKELGPIHHFGHPRSIAIGKDNSIIISSESGYTLLQQKFFIINIANEFDK